MNEKGTSIIGARLRIDNPDDNIFIGVSAKVSMVVAESDNTLLLPTEVVNTNTSGDFVYVIEDGVVQEKSVELGVSSDRQIEILKGLSEGDEVISDLSGDVKKGMKATGNLTDADDDNSSSSDGGQGSITVSTGN